MTTIPAHIHRQACVRIELPLPPSLWEMYRGHGKSKHLSPAYKAWRDGAGLLVNAQRKGRTVAGPFRIAMACERNSSLSDIDNRIKPVLDLLQFVGLVENDRLCQRVEAQWADGLPAECVVIVQEAVEAMAA